MTHEPDADKTEDEDDADEPGLKTETSQPLLPAPPPESELHGQFQSLDQLFRMIISGSTDKTKSSKITKPEKSSGSTTDTNHIKLIQEISPLFPSEQFGQYQIMEYLGHGGFGIVFRAFDIIKNQEVAIKILRKDRLNQYVTKKQFQYQTYLASRLEHPNIVKFLHRGVISGVPYLATEMIQGLTLDQVLLQSDRAPDLYSIIKTVQMVASAVEYGHSINVIHGDIKPANILVVPRSNFIPASYPESFWPLNTVKLFDFSLGEAIEPGDLKYKKMRNFMVTRKFAAPEQKKPALSRIDKRIDIYGLGMLLLFLLEHSQGMSRRHHRNYEIPGHLDLSNLDLTLRHSHERVAALVDQCLQLNPDARIQTVPEFKQMLKDCLIQNP